VKELLHHKLVERDLVLLLRYGNQSSRNGLKSRKEVTAWKYLMYVVDVAEWEEV